MTGTERGRDWLIVLGAMIAHAIPFGLVAYSFTIFFPPILEEFGAGKGATAWIISLATALMLGMSSIAGVLTDRLGSRRVLVAGTLLLGAGLLLSSRAGSIVELVLTYGLVGGAGASMTFVPAIAAVGRTFERRRGLALGLTASGSGLGAIAFAPWAQSLIDGAGWRPALRLLALVGTAALLVAAALMPRAHGADARGGSLRGLGSERAFRLIIASSLVAAFGYWVPFFFMAPYAIDHGLGKATAAGLVAVLASANTGGRIVMGAVADRVGRLRIMQIASVSMAVIVFGWPLATGLGPLVAFAILYGIAAGAFIALLPALAGDYFGPRRIGGVSGLIFAAAATGTLLSAPVSGTIFDVTDGYPVGILVAGATLAVGAVPLLLLPQPEHVPTRAGGA